MISGKIALGGLTLEFGNAKERFNALRQETDALLKAHTKLLDREKGIIEELAETYLPELTPGAVSAGLTELRAEMKRALKAQETHRRELVDRLAELPEEVTRRELLLAEAEGEEERAARGLEEIKALVEVELGADAAHGQNVSEHRAIMERRWLLKSRRLRLSTASSVDRRKYEENPAFSYLLRRQYGEPEYRGRLVTRWLDGWLASRIDYPKLIRNYRILKTGPAAIQTEVKRLTERAAEIEGPIDEQEAEVSTMLGLDAALAANASAQAAVRDARVALSDARARHDRLAAEIRAVEASRGAPYQNALAVHADFLQDQTVKKLVEIARQTADPKDDRLVSQLDEIRGRLEMVGEKLAPLRKQLDRQASRTTSLGDVARGALEKFTSRRSRFSEEFNLPNLVASIVDGDQATAEALSAIEASHVKRPLLEPTTPGDFDGWFAELSSLFDPELSALEVRFEHANEADAEVVVYDQYGRVLQRRVTKRKRS